MSEPIEKTPLHEELPFLNWRRLYSDPLVTIASLSPAHFMELMLPRSIIERTVVLTNINLRRDKKHPTTVTEILKLMGINLLMILNPVRGGREQFWTVESHGSQQALNFGNRFGMSKSRFEMLEKNLQFCEFNKEDKFWRIRQLIEDYNAYRKDVLHLSRHVCLDELFIMWYGKGPLYFGGMPHVTVIKNKPRGVEFELTAVSCGVCKVIHHLELQEGKKEMAKKKFQQRPAGMAKDAEYCALEAAGSVYPFHSAVTLRSTEKLFGSRRILYADAYFSSVGTLKALRKNGLYFVGMCKSAHKDYPKKFIQQWHTSLPPASHKHDVRICPLTAEYVVDNVTGKETMLALGYDQDERLGTLISSVGNTLADTSPHRVRRTRYDKDTGKEVVIEDEVYTVPRLVEQFRQYSCAVDQHNQLRQGILKAEENLKRNDWGLRFYNSLWCIAITDAFYMHSFTFRDSRDRIMDYLAFVDTIALQLVSGVMPTWSSMIVEDMAESEHEYHSSHVKQSLASSSSHLKNAAVAAVDIPPQGNEDEEYEQAVSFLHDNNMIQFIDTFQKVENYHRIESIQSYFHEKHSSRCGVCHQVSRYFCLGCSCIAVTSDGRPDIENSRLFAIHHPHGHDESRGDCYRTHTHKVIETGNPHHFRARAAVFHGKRKRDEETHEESDQDA